MNKKNRCVSLIISPGKMAAFTAAGPNFFDIQDDEGNTLQYIGNGRSTLKKLDWSLGKYTNLFIVPSKSSDLICSAYMYNNGIIYRTFWVQDPANLDPYTLSWAVQAPVKGYESGVPLAATQIVPAKDCGYYVMQGSTYMQKPDPKTGKVIYASTPVVWNLKPTTGQAFLLKSPDGSYVSLTGTAGSTIGSTTSIASAAVFELVEGHIVVYGTYKSPNVTAVVFAADSGGDITKNTFTVSPLTAADSITVSGTFDFVTVPGQISYFYTPPNSTTQVRQYLGMPSSGGTTFSTLSSATGSLFPVQPPASISIDPSTLFIYAYGASTSLKYANPTGYTFNPTVPVCKSKGNLGAGPIAGIAIGAVVVVGLVATGLWYWYKNKSPKT